MMGQNTVQDCLDQFEQVVATSNLIKPIPIYSITATQQKCARVEQQGSESTVVLPQIAICTLPNFYPGRQKRALSHPVTGSHQLVATLDTEGSCLAGCSVHAQQPHQSRERHCDDIKRDCTSPSTSSIEAYTVYIVTTSPLNQPIIHAYYAMP
jgi:hypothetical protein